MASIEWIQALSVGNGLLDSQHKKLISLINRLDEARGSGSPRQVISEVSLELGDYVREHFTLEEGLLKASAYPEVGAHIEEHRKFIARIAAFQKDYIAGQVELSGEILDFLKSWLTRHISMTDRKYRPYLADKRPGAE